MWNCPNCKRNFKVNNQSHMCVNKTVDDLFVDKPDNLVIAFDAIYQIVMDWEPCTAGASVNTVIFTNAKAWLIIRPMSKELDVKFYYGEPLDAAIFKKVTLFGKKYAHHIRISNELQISREIVSALRKGWEYGLE